MASKIALAIAGATAIIGVSPAPADGRSGRSSRMTSMRGTSAIRGTRYAENAPLVITPSVKLASSKAPASAITVASSTWLVTVSGFTITPH